MKVNAAGRNEKSTDESVLFSLELVPGAGIEPARPFEREILSLVCLPISPSGQRAEFYHNSGRYRLLSPPAAIV